MTIITSAEEGMCHLAFVCLFFCLLIASQINCWIDVHGNFTTDLSLDKEVTTELCNSSGSKNFFKLIFYHCGVETVQWTLLIIYINWEVVDEFLGILWRVGGLTGNKPFDFGDDLITV